MKEINSDNYEAFLLDYLEGNLDEKGISALKEFLSEHPEIVVPDDLADLPVLDNESISAGFKNALKREDAGEQIIAYLEGLLSGNEKSAFEEKLNSDPLLYSEYLAYKKTILTADTETVFETKSVLLKNDDELLFADRGIVYVENLFDPDEKHAYELELKASEKQAADLRLSVATVLKADTSIVYPDKNGLKKHGRVIALFSYRSVAAVAAGLVLIAALGIVFSQFSNETKIVSDKPHPQLSGHALQNTTRPVVPDQTALASAESILNTGSVQPRPSKKNNQHSVTPEINQVATNIHTMASTQDTTVGKTPSGVSQSEAPLLVSNNETLPEKLTPVKETETVLLASAEEDFDYFSQKENKKRWWQRVADVAGQANKAGIKSIDGESSSENKFRFSFNAFSVEKK